MYDARAFNQYEMEEYIGAEFAEINAALADITRDKSERLCDCAKILVIRHHGKDFWERNQAAIWLKARQKGITEDCFFEWLKTFPELDATA